MKFLLGPILAALALSAQAAGLSLKVEDLKNGDTALPEFSYYGDVPMMLLHPSQMPELREGTWTPSRRIVISARTRLTVTMPVSQYTEIVGRMLVGPDVVNGDYNDIVQAGDLGAKEVVLVFTNKSAKPAMVGYNWRPVNVTPAD